MEIDDLSVGDLISFVAGKLDPYTSFKRIVNQRVGWRMATITRIHPQKKTVRVVRSIRVSGTTTTAWAMTIDVEQIIENLGDVPIRDYGEIP